MASSIEEYLTPTSVGILIVGPTLLLAAAMVGRRVPAWHALRASRWAAATGTLVISCYSIAAQAYVHARWTDPNRWERRIAQNPHAVLYRELTFQDVLERGLRVMDPTAIAQCMEHDVPIVVFNYNKPGNIERAVMGERIGTLVASKPVAVSG